MNAHEKKRLAHIVKEVARLEASRKELADEIKEFLAVAKVELGRDAQVIKQLAKEINLDDLERSAQLLLEQELDECRVALGFMADLPLGKAAQERVAAAH